MILQNSKHSELAKLNTEANDLLNQIQSVEL